MKLIKRKRIVPVEDKNYLLLNGITGAIDLLDEIGYQIFNKWLKEDNIVPNESNTELLMP